MYKRKKYLVTGGAGFIGSHLVDALVKLGDVVVIDNLATGRRKNLNKKAKFVKADIRNFKKIKPYFKNVDYVFHCAANARIQPSIKNPRLSIGNNIVGTFNVLMAAKEAGVKRLVYSASSTYYGQVAGQAMHEGLPPGLKTPYALSKYVGEELCRLFSRLYGLKTVCLRYFNVYGERQLATGAYATVIGIFLRQVAFNKPMTIVGNGTKRRDFTHIKDVVRANLMAVSSQRIGNGESINIGTGKNYSIRQVAELIGGEHFLTLIKTNKAKFVPRRPGEAKNTLANIAKAKRLLAWEPQINFAETVKKLYAVRTL